MQWNCRSINTNHSYLLQHLASEKYKILIFQSLNVNVTNLPKLPTFYYPPIFEKAGIDGKIKTAIYVHESVEYSVCPSPVPDNTPNIHSCAARVKLSNDQIVNIVSVYLPKGPHEDNTDWVRSIQISKEKWIIAGDFNAHSPFWEKDNVSLITSKRLLENIVDSSLYLLNDGSVTRIPDISTQRATAIDLSLISPILAPHCAWETYSDSLGSDHLPIIITLYGRSAHNECVKDKIPKYSYNKANWDLFQSFLKVYDTSCIECDDIDMFYDRFTKTVLQAADCSIPRCSSIKSDKHAGNLWWNETCENAVNKKKIAFKTYIRNKSRANHIFLKLASKTCDKIIEQVKREFWSNFCEKEICIHKDMQKVWKKFNEMKHGINQPLCPIAVKDKEFPSDSDKAEAFIDMFANTLSDTCLSQSEVTFRKEETKKDIYKDPLPDNTLFINTPITLQEVMDVIQSLNNGKTSVGIDAISNQMLKHLPEN